MKKTINSTYALRQRDVVSQLIIDSSSGPLAEEIKNFVSLEKNITYFWQEPSGISAAFNYGIENAKTDWLWFLNGGDKVIDSLNINNFIYILSSSNSHAIIFQTKIIQASLRTGHPQMWALWPPLLSWIPHPCTLTRRELFDKFGKFDKTLKIAMDYEFWVRCFARDVTVDLISIPISEFDQTGISNSLNKQTKAEVRKVIRRHFWLIVKRWFS